MSSIFVLVSLLGLAAGYVSKQHSLGVHLFFIPSMSMYPTLKPGQFILLDTWVYRDSTPQLNDVVVFQQGDKEQCLVKRIANWPDGQLQRNKQWYVLGDNRQASQDSRSFGGINKERIIGQVKLVLLGIDQYRELQTGSVLQVVH